MMLQLQREANVTAQGQQAEERVDLHLVRRLRVARHDLAAALVANGETEMAKGLYKQQFCIVDELPCLAASGLLVEINFVRELIVKKLTELQ